MSFDLTPMPNTPPSSVPTANAPIADLSYRNYDGPLQTRAIRWWIVALAGIRPALKKPGFWILALMAALPYLGTGFALYFQSHAGVPIGGGEGAKYAPYFMQALRTQGLFIFLMALTVGAGGIAADNQANALLVYLSKPITKGDYLLGKWMSIFLILCGLSLLPALLLYLFCLFSYLSDGFLTREPLLLLRVLLASMVPAVMHASLIIGFSAWSKTARMAGAFYAGVYFVSIVIAHALAGPQFDSEGNFQQSPLLSHLSISGLIEGVTQNIYHVTKGFFIREIPLPPFGPLLAIAILVCVTGVLAARMKIRAVEVVGG